MLRVTCRIKYTWCNTVQEIPFQDNRKYRRKQTVSLWKKYVNKSWPVYVVHTWKKVDMTMTSVCSLLIYGIIHGSKSLDILCDIIQWTSTRIVQNIHLVPKRVRPEECYYQMYIHKLFLSFRVIVFRLLSYWIIRPAGLHSLRIFFI